MAGRLSVRGFQFLKTHEGCFLKPYKAVSTEKYYSVGYGHYGPDVDPNKTYTQQECENFFASDKAWVERDVNKVWDDSMTQGMFDAMFSYAYNTGNISKSTLKGLIMDNEYLNVDRLTTAWKKSKITSGGKQLAGLVTRRADEVKLFYSNEPDGGPFEGNSSSAPSYYSASNMTNDNLTTPSQNYPKTSGGAGNVRNNDTAQVSDRYSQANNYETFNSVLAGAQLNTTDTASLVVIKNEEENNKRTRIYKAGEVKVVVDELSMPLVEATLTDTSTENQEIPA